MADMRDATAHPRENINAMDTEKNAQDIPEIPPLPDVADTSYMSAPFQAPPRFPGDEKGESGSSQPSGYGATAGDAATQSRENPVSDSNTAEAEKKTTVAAESTSVGKTRGVFAKAWKKSRRNRLPEGFYKAASAHFLASYRNPLEDEEVKWEKPKVRLPLVGWILFGISALASLINVAIMVFASYLLDIPHLHSIDRGLLAIMVFAIVIVGCIVNLTRLRRPPFWNKFHTLFFATCFLWGFGGVSGLSSLVVTAWFDATYSSSTVHDLVSLILPISLWTGFILVAPTIVAMRLIPVWERHAPLMRLGALNIFWGSYAGIVLTLLSPYFSREKPWATFLILCIAVLPTVGIFAMGLVVCLPLRWPVPFTAYLNHILGILLLAFGVAVVMSVVLVPNMKIGVRVAVGAVVLVMIGLGLWALLGISPVLDPLIESNLSNLQTWVDADVISPDEYEFMCNEMIVAKWGSVALRRGVFFAARDYYRAVMQLAFLDFGDEKAQPLVNTVHTTRRKLEAAGIPPRVEFEKFAEAPIFPDVLE